MHAHIDFDASRRLMISTTHNFIFIHAPKTGGNSIQNILRKYSEDVIVTKQQNQDGWERFGVENKQFKTIKHSPLTQYKHSMNTDLYNRMYKFSTIRNPWDMMISLYFSPHWGPVKWNRREFINLVLGTYNLRDYITTSPNTKRLDDEIDRIMRFEYLEADFSSVCKCIGAPSALLPVCNKSIRTHYNTYYDDELIELVANKFSEEIEFGEYSFET